MKNAAVLALVVVVALMVLATIINATDVEVSEEGGDVIFRHVRSVGGKAGNKGRQGAGACRYIKGTWSDCDTTLNKRTRTLTLKKRGGSDKADCEPMKTESRNCKKACRYSKGEWTECDVNLHMKERIDQIKPGSDPTCESTRRMSKKCKSKSEKKQKG